MDWRIEPCRASEPLRIKETIDVYRDPGELFEQLMEREDLEESLQGILVKTIKCVVSYFTIRMSSLLEETIAVLDDLMAKQQPSLPRGGQIDGIGVKLIYGALASRHIPGRHPQESRLKYSEVFDVLCTSVESVSIFQFEGADHRDAYFSLKGPKEEMLEIARSMEKPPPLDVTMYEIDKTPVEMPNFEQLAAEVGELLKDELNMAARSAELVKDNETLEAEIAAFHSPSLDKQITAMQETLSRLE